MDEIHTLILGVAYSNADKTESSEHIVNISPTPDLYRHIRPEVIDKMDSIINSGNHMAVR